MQIKAHVRCFNFVLHSSYYSVGEGDQSVICWHTLGSRDSPLPGITEHEILFRQLLFKWDMTLKTA